MNCVERLKHILKERNIPFSKVEKDLGFGNGYISQLRGESIRYDRLIMFAEYLKLSPDYLMYGEAEKSPASEDTELDSDSIKILELLHQLTPENSVRAIAYIQGLVDTQ